MFTGALVWRGIVFTILMLVGKLATGILLIRVAAPSGTNATKVQKIIDRLNAPQWSCWSRATAAKIFSSRGKNTADTANPKAMPDIGIARATISRQSPKQPSDRPPHSTPEHALSSATPAPPQASAPPTKSRSLYPAAIVGTAMMARGEIGFLIAALAESTGIFASHEESATREDGGSEIYLVAIWAIVLCTVISPVSVGLLVRRVKKLQQQRRVSGGGEDPLGTWGVL